MKSTSNGEDYIPMLEWLKRLLTSADKPGYAIIRGVLNVKDLEEMIPALYHYHARNRIPVQSGVGLGSFPGFPPSVYSALERMAATEFKCDAFVSLGHSSFRIQRPTGELSMAPHQDHSALNLKKRGQKGLTFWVPLCEIDDETPTLAIADHRSQKFMPHEGDEAGYSVLSAQYAQPLKAMFGLVPGDVVMIWPDTVHCSFVPIHANKTRISMDIRAFPVTSPHPPIGLS